MASPLTRQVDISASLKDSSSGLGLVGQSLAVVETPQGGVPVPLPPMTTAPDGSALQTVAVQAPGTYTFTMSYAGGTVGAKSYSPSTGLTTIHIGTKTLSGKVTAETGAGEQVTIIVTGPTGVVETLFALTRADLTFSVEYDGTLQGNYSAVAKIAKDATYSPATSPLATGMIQ